GDHTGTRTAAPRRRFHHRERREARGRGSRRTEDGPLLLPQGRHPRLHQGGLRLPGPNGRLRRGGHP
ncbi:MAG: Thiol peroxidase, Bcp-type, partial [uncultured Rubrobacteraceae bacterium]